VKLRVREHLFGCRDHSFSRTEHSISRVSAISGPQRVRTAGVCGWVERGILSASQLRPAGFLYGTLRPIPASLRNLRPGLGTMSCEKYQ
jgi:hypothetical protein